MWRVDGILSGQEHAAENRSHAEYVEKVRCRLAAADGRRLLPAQQERPAVISGEIREDTIAGAPVEVVGIGCFGSAIDLRLECLPEMNEAFRASKREWS